MEFADVVYKNECSKFNSLASLKWLSIDGEKAKSVVGVLFSASRIIRNWNRNLSRDFNVCRVCSTPIINRNLKIFRLRLHPYSPCRTWSCFRNASTPYIWDTARRYAKQHAWSGWIPSSSNFLQSWQNRGAKFLPSRMLLAGLRFWRYRRMQKRLPRVRCRISLSYLPPWARITPAFHCACRSSFSLWTRSNIHRAQTIVKVKSIPILVQHEKAQGLNFHTHKDLKSFRIFDWKSMNLENVKIFKIRFTVIFTHCQKFLQCVSITFTSMFWLCAICFMRRARVRSALRSALRNIICRSRRFGLCPSRKYHSKYCSATRLTFGRLRMSTS